MADIEVLLNCPREEIEKQGFRVFRFGPSLQPGKFIAASTDTKGGKSGAQQWADSDSRDFVRNPGTGAIQVRPSGLRDDFLESTSFGLGKLAETDWNYQTTQWEVIDFAGYASQSGALKGFFPKLPDASTDLTARTVSEKLTKFTSDVVTTLRWTHETKANFPINIGFGFIVQPMGTSQSKGSTLMAIGFGGRYVLELKTNGVATVYAYLATEKWEVVGTFDYASSGVKPSDPFQVNIIPNAYGYISFFFSQYSQSSKVGQSTSGKNVRKDTGFTVNMRRYFDIVFDKVKGTSNTIPAATVCLAFRKRQFRVLWSAYKNIYDAAVHPEVAFRPEALPHRLDHAQPMSSTSPYRLQLSGFGFESNQTGSDLSGKNRIELAATATDGTGDWSNADKVIPIKAKFYPSTFYSPELWGYRCVIPEKTHTPSWTPIDVSDKWQRISWKQSLDHDPMTAEIRLINLEQKELFKSYGPVRIKAKGEIVYEGYLKERKPVLENRGNSVLMHDLFQCLDVSTRFAETRAGFDSIAGVTVRSAIERLINQCGIPLSAILFEESDDWTNTTTIEQPEGSDQDKVWSANVSVAEALTAIFDLYSVQGEDKLSVFRRAGKYVIKSNTKYKYASKSGDYVPPVKRFWLGEPKKATGNWDDQDARWTDKQFKIFEPVEFFVESAPFNLVRVTVGKETAEDSKGISTSTIFDTSGSITDPDNDEFAGRVKEKTVEGPKAFQISTLAEAERFARGILDIFGHKRIGATFHAEWQPGNYVNDIVSILGAIEVPTDDGVEIKTVSFGAYRIIEQQPLLEHDEEDNNFTWSADYTAEYWGPSEYPEEDILYFNPGHDGHVIAG